MNHLYTYLLFGNRLHIITAAVANKTNNTFASNFVLNLLSLRIIMKIIQSFFPPLDPKKFIYLFICDERNKNDEETQNTHTYTYRKADVSGMDAINFQLFFAISRGFSQFERMQKLTTNNQLHALMAARKIMLFCKCFRYTLNRR